MGAPYYDDLQYLNILPKQLLRKKLFFATSISNDENLKDIERVTFVFEINKGKCKKLNI